MTAEALLEQHAAAEWSVWSTTARLVVTEARALDRARALVVDHLDAVDRAASRFRADSEVSAIARSSRTSHVVSPLLAELVTVALEAAELTGGAVDPTLGNALCDLGYDADGLGGSEDAPANVNLSRHHQGRWREVFLDGDRLSLPPGTLLDLGATAKARAADHCAELVAGELGAGALVSLGGDIRVAGPEPQGGWNVLVQDGDGDPTSLVRLTGAQAVATSSTLRRTWRRDGKVLHHVLDPLTGLPAAQVWRTVTVAAENCVRANTLSTQAVVLGEDALRVLESNGVAARLVDAERRVHLLGGWPA